MGSKEKIEGVRVITGTIRDTSREVNKLIKIIRCCKSFDRKTWSVAVGRMRQPIRVVNVEITNNHQLCVGTGGKQRFRADVEMVYKRFSIGKARRSIKAAKNLCDVAECDLNPKGLEFGTTEVKVGKVRRSNIRANKRTDTTFETKIRVEIKTGTMEIKVVGRR